eukprot:905133-Pleurochrysis_carterae.AAC.2
MALNVRRELAIRAGTGARGATCDTSNVSRKAHPATSNVSRNAALGCAHLSREHQPGMEIQIMRHDDSADCGHGLREGIFKQCSRRESAAMFQA